MLAKEVKYLLKKELLLELRQKYALGGILLYIISTIFVCYLTFTNITQVPTWNALFWIIMLFTATNAIAKSFVQETDGRQLYLYTLVSPQAVIIAKIVYNIILKLVLSILGLATYATFIGSHVLQEANLPMFFSALIIGSIGFACMLTMVSAIASRTNNNAGLMAILGFPIMLPLLMALIRFSKAALAGLDWSVGWKNGLLILVINVMVAALSYLLFPYLWRE
jgi:heme exporter protein B